MQLKFKMYDLIWFESSIQLEQTSDKIKLLIRKINFFKIMYKCVYNN